MLIGRTTFEMGAVLGSKGSIKAKQLDNTVGGTVFARVAKASDHDLGMLFLNVRGEDVVQPKSKTTIKKPKSKYFYELASAEDDAGYGLEWKTVLRSAIIKEDHCPSWEVQTVPVDHLNGGEYDKTLRLSVLHEKKKGSNQVVGVITTTLNEILEIRNNKRSLPLMNGKNKEVGQIYIALADIDGATDTPTGLISQEDTLNQTASIKDPIRQDIIMPNFVDYIYGGCKINLNVAIDFTDSNGHHSNPTSLHYTHPDGSLNEYERAIKAVGSTIAKYDWDQIFSVWGFGGKMGGVLQHFFQVGFNAKVKGVDGIIENYREIFESDLEMGSETILAETIRRATKNAKLEWVSLFLFLSRTIGYFIATHQIVFSTGSGL